jgi:hypothetical protein
MLSYKLLKNIKLKKKYSVFLKNILNRYVKKIHFKADEFYSKIKFRALYIHGEKKLLATDYILAALLQVLTDKLFLILIGNALGLV